MLSSARAFSAAPCPTALGGAASTARCRRPAARQPPAGAHPCMRRSTLPTPMAALERPHLQMDDETRGQLPSWLTLAGYAAMEVAHRTGLTSFHLSAPFIYRVLAWYTLAWAALSAVDRVAQFDPTALVVGPMFLAADYLGFFGGRITPLQTAAALFGYFWIDQLPAFPYSRLAWLATLVAAIYNGAPAQWLVGALGLSALWRIVEQVRSGSGVRPQELAFVALAGFAFYTHVEVPVALTMMAAQMAASLVS